MTTEKKARLEFTAEELEQIYFALNSYCVENMHRSETWGATEAFIANGYKHDIWGRTAEAAGRLQIRIYKAQERLNK